MQRPEKMGLFQGQAVKIPSPLTKNQNQLFV